MSRNLRVLVLLSAFALVASVTLWERVWVRSSGRTLQVAIYPVAVDAPSAEFVARLRPEDFQEIATFVSSEAQRWRKRTAPPPQVMVKQSIRELPPLPTGRGQWDAIQYSLSLRWYAFRHTPFWESLAAVRLFVLYHEVKYNEPLPHSLGLQKGLLGVVHVFASDGQRAQNNVVITHELLHTLGATDKYSADGQPTFPEGFADYASGRRYPQFQAEIMAGRIPISQNEARIPANLTETVVGYKTASEVGW